LWWEIPDGFGDNRRFRHLRCHWPAFLGPSDGASRRRACFHRLPLLPHRLDFPVTLDQPLPFSSRDGLVSHWAVGSLTILIQRPGNDCAVIDTRVVHRNIVYRNIALLNPRAGRPCILVVASMTIGGLQSVMPTMLVTVAPAMMSVNRIVAVVTDVK
jgi:hypothetical protein